MTTALDTRAARERRDRFYRLVRATARFWLWFFFKSVDVRHPERVPDAGPVLLCINHPNNFIDSLLVGAAVRRKVHYLATAGLFRRRLVASFLRACGAIPVYRRQDDPRTCRRPPTVGAGLADPATTEKNADTFAACADALAEGRVIAIYPEGTTHAEARVQRIKTGAARIALAYEAERPGELRLVPVGLTFDARKSFRGRVLVSFGPPVPVAPSRDAYRQDPVKAVEALTTAIQWAMEAEVVHVARIDATQLVRAVEGLYRDELARELAETGGVPRGRIDPIRLSRSIVDAVSHFRARDPERVERLWQRIEGYRALLAEYHVKDEAVRARLEPQRRARRIRLGWQAVVGLPLFAYGASVNLLPYWIPRWTARRMARKETDYATWRFLASVVAYPTFWGIEGWLVARVFGAPTAGGAVVPWRGGPLGGPPPPPPLGGAARAPRHFAESIAARLVAARPGWSVVLAPTLHLGSFTFDAPGTVSVRQRVVRDALVDYGVSLARAGFRYILVANGHAGPGHLAALDEAAATVSRRYGISMASFTGHLAWQFLRGRYLDKIGAALGRPLSDAERQASAEDAHGGRWGSSLMLLGRPDLVDGAHRTLPPARHPLAPRVLPNYPLRNGGLGYVGHPALADPDFARATTEVLIAETMALVEGLLDGRIRPGDRRSPFFALPLFRTDFWPLAPPALALIAAGAIAWLWKKTER